MEHKQFMFVYTLPCIYKVAVCCLLLFSGFFSTDLVPQLSTAEMAQMRNKLFEKEKDRQLSLYPRIEKIEVKYVGKSHPGTVFIMNKGLSTPYTCAMRK